MLAVAAAITSFEQNLERGRPLRRLLKYMIVVVARSHAFKRAQKIEECRGSTTDCCFELRRLNFLHCFHTVRFPVTGSNLQLQKLLTAFLTPPCAFTQPAIRELRQGSGNFNFTVTVPRRRLASATPTLVRQRWLSLTVAELGEHNHVCACGAPDFSFHMPHCMVAISRFVAVFFFLLRLCASLCRV